MRSLLVVVALAGCGGGVAIADYQTKLRDARCSFEVRCGLFPDQASCTAFFPVADDPSLAAAVDQGKSTYDADKAEQCVNETANADCNGTTREGREVPAVCFEVVGGTGKMSDACVSNSECESKACDVPTCMMACCPGTCGVANPKAALGEPCATRTCETGLTCDNTKTCADLFAAGVPCQSGDQCAYGLGCVGTPSTCKVLPELGEPCPDMACAEIGATCSAGTCVALGLPGTLCVASTDCSPYFTCDLLRGDCAPFPTRGQSCTITCSDDSWCNIPSGMTTGTCDAPQANGSVCVFNDSCLSGFCDNSTGVGICTAIAVCI